MVWELRVWGRWFKGFGFRVDGFEIMLGCEVDGLVTRD